MSPAGNLPELVLRPIGIVSRGCAPGGGEERWEDHEAEITMDPDWTAALEGIEAFSHVWIVWWLDRSEGTPEDLRVHPEKRPDLPLVGLFATRSPRRPNPVGLTAVQLLGREGGSLRVQGLDAFVGSPILDIKPYLRRGDLVPEASTPEWLARLWQAHDLERSAAERGGE